MANVFAWHCCPRTSPLCSHIFRSMSTDLLIPKMWLLKFDFENPRLRSWVRSKFKVTTWVQHPVDWHPFGSMSIHHLIPIIELFINLTFKTQGQSHSSMSHSRYNILSTHIPFVPCWSALPFLRYRYFENWPWKSKSKAMGEVKVQCHNVRLTFYRLTSLWFILIGPPIPAIQYFQNSTLKIQSQGQMTMMLHSYRSRQFHRTSNGINPSNGFRNMGPAKFGPSAAWFDKFLAHGQAHMGKWANDHNSA